RERPLKKSRKCNPEHTQWLRRQGVQRALVYKMAALTLARFGAIRRLIVTALHLDAKPPHALFPARHVKGRRMIAKVLHPDLVQDLKDWIQLTGRSGTDRVFDVSRQITRALRKDLAYAGIPYKDGLGRTFDFHALKKTGITALARARVDVLKVRD